MEKFEKHVERNKEKEEWSKRKIESKAWQKTLPTVHRKLEYNLETFWILHELANKSKSFQNLVGTKRKLVTSEHYDNDEAIRYTIKKRRYLIQKVTETLLDDPPLLGYPDEQDDE